jgi:hypothetical protein
MTPFSTDHHIMIGLVPVVISKRRNVLRFVSICSLDLELSSSDRIHKSFLVDFKNLNSPNFSLFTLLGQYLRVWGPLKSHAIFALLASFGPFGVNRTQVALNSCTCTVSSSLWSDTVHTCGPCGIRELVPALLVRHQSF